ncbi:TPM domain-containing protein [Nocardia spumae]|uniref:TPM domain-containing protein n=1 Tax=Nocardia spumae TaxID=2887190 RepID=UPI001D13409E|nr:TPM domain-containing protein [Nocardia spumae]
MPPLPRPSRPQPPAMLAALVSIVIGLVLGCCGPAVAEEPTRLDTYITDTAQVLDDSQRDTVRASLDALYTSHRERLWVVYVRDFGGLDPRTWGERTAQASGFGDRDVLLSIATADRSYAFTGALPPSVSESELNSLLTDQVEPRLRNAQWADAAIATADGLSTAMGDSGGVGIWPLIVITLIVLGVIGTVLGYSRLRRRARGRAEAEAARAVDPTDAAALTRMRPDLLDARSAQVLVDTDNAIRDSAEELRLATDEFGATATAPFAAALEAAKQAMAHAFSIRQRLDDDIPETPDERRDLLVELISTCGRADAELDAKVSEFDAMRDLLIDAPQRLDALTRDVVDLTVRVPGAQDTLRRLLAAQPESVTAPVRDNVTMAQERIGFAEQTIEQGRRAAAQPVGRQGGVVAAIRGAEAAVTAARALLDAVDTAETDITQARAGLPAAVAELERDLETASGLTEHGGAELAAAVVGARTALDTARGTGEADPLGTFQRAVAADNALDRAVAAAGERTFAADQLRRRLDQAMTAAQAQVRAAGDFIDTRRGGIDATPRTRLAEAQRNLARAQTLSATDPQSALDAAQQAAELATRALSAAQADVRDWQARQPVSGTSQAGAVLGGILIDSLLRGAGSGYRNRPMGGTNWGPASFGGSGGSRRISRGGRF